MKPSNTSERLRLIMSKQNLKQVDILSLAHPYCKKYGVSLGKTALSQYISGKFEPRQDKLTILGLALNVSEAWLMGYDVPMERSPERANQEHTPAPTPSPLTPQQPGSPPPEDPVTAEILNAVRSMPAEQQQQVLQFAQYLADRAADQAQK